MVTGQKWYLTLPTYFPQETAYCRVSTVLVVVGAGEAGLSAASTLVKSGFQQVQVLEAMSRPGGRIHTTKPFGQNIIELGANWIQEGNTLFQGRWEELWEDRLIAWNGINGTRHVGSICLMFDTVPFIIFQQLQ